MRTLLLAGAFALAAPLAEARPDTTQSVDTRLLQRQDLPYAFETEQSDSVDGQRHYQLWIGVPKKPAPPGGYPVIWMLDGNAAFSALDEAQLTHLARGDAPMLVAVGYQGDQRFERSARSFDYTPAGSTAPGEVDPLTGQPSGGADLFLDLLTQRIRPSLASKWPMDMNCQTIWGHSYGGLLVLHALFTRPDAFSDYVAASPSLWWGDGAAAREAEGLTGRLPVHGARLLLMRGSAEPAAPGQPPTPGADQAMRNLLAQLRQVEGLTTRYQAFDGLGHGPMLPASLHALLDERGAP